MFSLHTHSSWANVWNTFWMASTGPVGKSHTVTFYCRDRNGRRNWERQTGKTPSWQNIYSLESRVILSWRRGVCRKHDTVFIRATHTGGVKTHEHGRFWFQRRYCVGCFFVFFCFFNKNLFTFFIKMSQPQEEQLFEERVEKYKTIYVTNQVT